jgi:hypothetical protein
MENEKAPYWRRYDWDGDGDVDDKDAVVYLAQHVLIRLTDTNKDPVPKAKCRIIGDEATVYECDEDGVAHIPVSDWSIKGLDLEWERHGAETNDPSNRYYWKNSFDLNVCDRNDDACRNRLTNLGFTGGTLAEQVNAYQKYFGRSTPSHIDKIRTEMADWHDGGTYPGLVTIENTTTPETREKI